MSSKISLKQTALNEGFDNIMEFLEDFGYDSIVPACCSHGCIVEPDGTCEHGNPSVLIEAGII